VNSHDTSGSELQDTAGLDSKIYSNDNNGSELQNNRRGLGTNVNSHDTSGSELGKITPGRKGTNLTTLYDKMNCK
jgi:hypothetical protein